MEIGSKIHLVMAQIKQLFKMSTAWFLIQLCGQPITSVSANWCWSVYQPQILLDNVLGATLTLQVRQSTHYQEK